MYKSRFQTYYWLTKPGIVYGNVLSAMGGFLFGSKWHFAFGLFLATVVGIALVIASACVFNNYIDRGIDKHMARTKKRALVSGAIEGPHALWFGAILGLFGFCVLAWYTNTLTLTLGVIAYVDYIILYGYSKRRSVHGTLVGSISGSMPVVAGYTAATNRFDTGAVLLFVILTAWQMPHFYAIAIYRLKDYAKAGLPVWPVKKGLLSTKVQILLYTVAFSVASGLLTLYGYTGYTYFVIMTGLGLAWFYKALQGFRAKNNTVWARKYFLFSLVIITALPIMLAIGRLLP